MLSEAVKMLKGEYTVWAIKQMKMDRAIIFCRTKLDCDNMENYLNQRGGGQFSPVSRNACCPTSSTWSEKDYMYWLRNWGETFSIFLWRLQRRSAVLQNNYENLVATLFCSFWPQTLLLFQVVGITNFHASVCTATGSLRKGRATWKSLRLASLLYLGRNECFWFCSILDLK